MHSSNEWLAAGDAEVTLPFAETLAELVWDGAVRLRRDFGKLLNLIRAHALLHQATRERDARGRIVATIDDYAAVRELVHDLISEGVEGSVSDTMRETVLAVPAGSDGMTVRQLAETLGIDKSAASRRWRAARDKSYLRDQEERKNLTSIVRADPLPDDVQVLPTPETLAAACCSVDPETDRDPPPPPTADTKEAASHLPALEQHNPPLPGVGADEEQAILFTTGRRGYSWEPDQ